MEITITQMNYLVKSEGTEEQIGYQKNIPWWEISIKERLKFIQMEEEFKEQCLLLKTTKLS